MPDIGNTSLVSDGEDGLGACRGIRFTMPEAGSAGVTVTFRLRNDGGAANVKAVIFNSDGTVNLAESNVRADIAGEASYQFSGGGLATFTPANGTTYLAICFSTSGDVQILKNTVASPNGNRVSDQDASTFGPPAAFSAFGAAFDDAANVLGFMTYAVAGGSESEPVVAAQAVFQGQTIGLRFAAQVIAAHAVFEGSNVGTTADVNRIEPIVAAQAAWEPQQILFGFGAPRDHAEAVFQGGEITFNLRLVGNTPHAVFEGQEVGLIPNLGVREEVIAADAVFVPSTIILTASGNIPGGNDMVQDARAFVRPMSFDLGDTDR